MEVARKVRWEKGKEYLLAYLDLIKKEIERMEWLIKNKEEFERRHPSNHAGLEMGLAMDSILRYLNHIFDYELTLEGDKYPLTMAEYLALTNQKPLIKTVKPHGNGAYITLPKDWIGKQVLVISL